MYLKTAPRESSCTECVIGQGQKDKPYKRLNIMFNSKSFQMIYM